MKDETTKALEDLAKFLRPAPQRRIQFITVGGIAYPVVHTVTPIQSCPSCLNRSGWGGVR